MKSLNYFAALAVVCAVSFASCDNDPDLLETNVTNAPVPSRHISHPDSIQVYKIAADSTEKYTCTIYYAYDATGNVISEREPNTREERQYDGHNNLVEVRRYEYRSYLDEWEGFLKWLYTYDDNNKRKTTIVYYDFHDDMDEEPWKKGNYTWQDDTHCQCVIFKRWGQEWVLNEIGNYTYNSDGDLIYETYYFCKPDSTPPANGIYEQAFEYDIYGNPISSYYVDNYTRIEDTYTYIYDKYGNILIKWQKTNRTSDLNSTPKTSTSTSKSVYFY